MRVVLVSAMACLLAAPVVGQQQDNSGSTAQQTAGKKSDAQKKEPAAQVNPFPEGKSEKAEQQQQKQQLPSAPAAPAPPTKKKSAAEANPFPEAQSEKAAQADQKQESQPGAGQDQQESSSSQVKGLEPPEWAPAPVAKPAGGFELNPKLGKKDTQVGHFYLQSGDYKGAYDRFMEATKVDPGNAEAVFGLAEAAQRLNMRDEALRNYRLYLDALPNGRDAKEARKALKEMGGGS